MPISAIDLHIHTHYSDGKHTPEEIVRHAAAAGMRALAITDHDNTNGVREAVPLAAELGIEIIPGIEMTCRWGLGAPEPDEIDIDLLGYFFDLNDREFHAYEQACLRDYQERTVEYCQALSENGFPLTLEDVLAENPRYAGALQLYLAFITKGYARNWDESVERASVYLQGIRASPFTLTQSIQQIHLAGGVALLAHPSAVRCNGSLLSPQQLDLLNHVGLDGIEIYHKRLDENQRAYFLKQAQRLGWLVSGGSDMHGWWSEGLHNLGSQSVTDGMLAALREKSNHHEE